MKLKILFVAIFSILSMDIFAFSGPGYEFGLGSGYIFYGGTSTKNMTSKLSSPTQVIFYTDTTALFPIADSDIFFFTVGLDATLDARWSGSYHIFMLDYSGLFGFRIFPGLAGLCFNIEYAIGRRTDFVNIKKSTSYFYSLEIKNIVNDIFHTEWGNGFKLGLSYDFSVHTHTFAPIIGANWKFMPRGDCADNIISVFLRFTNHIK